MDSFDWRCPPDDMPKGRARFQSCRGNSLNFFTTFHHDPSTRSYFAQQIKKSAVECRHLHIAKVEETRSWQMLAPGCVTRLWRDLSRRMRVGPGREQVANNHDHGDRLLQMFVLLPYIVYIYTYLINFNHNSLMGDFLIVGCR